ncbi:MAG: bud emergence protein 1 [Trichoglossum hirsutum]|nr:MAG: bud emergence protein 1 [Trichoglossum hirsutum]
MKALRRSMKGEKTETKIQHISITPKSAITIVPPKKASAPSRNPDIFSPVIKALFDYEAQLQQELSFVKGDFFHVIDREDDTDWYEACNPATGARGLVPVTFFQVLGRTAGRDSAGSTTSSASTKVIDNDSGYSDRSGGVGSNSSDATARPARYSKGMGKGSGAMVYGVVMYDFAAERPDELEAKAGEAIIVIAQSNPEWFVAKPIGRLGGPGLIPVSFIEIRDMTTGQPVPDAHEAVQRAGVPKVEEWKKMAADYKNSSITLGKFASEGTQSMQQDLSRLTLTNGGQNHQNGHGRSGSTQSYHQRNGSKYGSPNQNPFGSRPSSNNLLAPVSASIPRYCFANDKYWYIIEATMEDGRHWELSRFYQDFYDFQIALLTEFPEDAGNAGKPRTLPFMPGPVTIVTDTISNGRRQNLDEYIKKLLAMPPKISRCHLVRQLFAPREGDFEIERPTSTEDLRRLSATSQHSSGESGGASRQSSRGNLNGNGYHPGLSAPSRAAHQRSQPSVSNGVAQAVHYRSPSDLQLPSMLRQNSSQTQGSQGSGGATGTQASAMKIKIHFQDDLIAIRVPMDINFQQLKEKVMDRLHVGDDAVVQYRDEPTGDLVELLSDRDLDAAIQRNSKLTLVVK